MILTNKIKKMAILNITIKTKNIIRKNKMDNNSISMKASVNVRAIRKNSMIEDYAPVKLSIVSIATFGVGKIFSKVREHSAV